MLLILLGQLRPYIADVISSIIDEVGASNVVQVVMDNAKNWKHAGQILKQ